MHEASRTRARRATRGSLAFVMLVGVLVASGLTAAGAATSTDDGVTDKSVTIGYVTSQTGLAGSTFQNADMRCTSRWSPTATSRWCRDSSRTA